MITFTNAITGLLSQRISKLLPSRYRKTLTVLGFVSHRPLPTYRERAVDQRHIPDTRQVAFSLSLDEWHTSRPHWYNKKRDRAGTCHVRERLGDSGSSYGRRPFVRGGCRVGQVRKQRDRRGSSLGLLLMKHVLYLEDMYTLPR